MYGVYGASVLHGYVLPGMQFMCPGADRMGGIALKIDGQKVLIVYEEGKAPWSKPLCKLGLHKWLVLGLIEGYDPKVFDFDSTWVGFNISACSKGCGVQRYWKPHVRQ